MKEELEKLFEHLGKLRDEYVYLRDNTVAREQSEYYDGMAVAFDTVRGLVFQIIGEEDSGNESEE